MTCGRTDPLDAKDDGEMRRAFIRADIRAAFGLPAWGAWWRLRSTPWTEKPSARAAKAARGSCNEDGLCHAALPDRWKHPNASRCEVGSEAAKPSMPTSNKAGSRSSETASTPAVLRRGEADALAELRRVAGDLKQQKGAKRERSQNSCETHVFIQLRAWGMPDQPIGRSASMMAAPIAMAASGADGQGLSTWPRPLQG
jgi:hypothetical protein